MNFLGFLFMMPIAIEEKIFAPPLAFIANQFTVLSNDIPLSVTGRTNHFSLLVDNAYETITRVGCPGSGLYAILKWFARKKCPDYPPRITCRKRKIVPIFHRRRLNALTTSRPIPKACRLRRPSTM